MAMPASGRCFAGTIILAGFVELTKFAFTLASNRKELLSQFDGLLLRVGAKDGEPADQFLGFGERPIGHSDLVSGEAYASAQGAWQAAFRGEQPAGLEALFDELAHFRHFFLRW